MKNKILWCIIFFLSASIAWADGDSVFNERITGKFNNIELQKVLQSLSEKTGLLIVYDEQISHKKVSGSFKERPLTEVVNRLLSGTNHSLQMDDKGNTLFIKAFGKVKYVSTGGGQGIAGLLPNTEVSYAELRALLNRQVEDFNRHLVDGSEFINEFGMTRSEVQAQLERQQEQFDQVNQDSDHFITEMNMTTGELRAMQGRQQKAFEQYTQNDDSIADDGTTLGEHRATLAEQSARYQKGLNDTEEMMSEFGITRGAHKKILAEQMKRFKHDLTE